MRTNEAPSRNIQVLQPRSTALSPGSFQQEVPKKNHFDPKRFALNITRYTPYYRLTQAALILADVEVAAETPNTDTDSHFFSLGTVQKFGNCAITTTVTV